MGFDGSLIKTILRYSQFYFVTIAVTLGSGVLGLPTTLANSGIQPFLITIIASYIVQILILTFFTEVLQKAYARNIEKLQESDKDSIPILIESYELSTYGSQDNLLAKPAPTAETIRQCSPNLHGINELFLPYFLPNLATLTIFLSITIFLISYTLAGSQAFAALFNLTFYQIIPIFAWVLTAVLIVFHGLITQIISAVTLVKGIFFVAAVFLTFAAGLQNPIKVINDFGATGDSFLMSLVALSGYANAMPLMFIKVRQTRNGIIGFKVAIFLALTTCLLLNIIWCWAVLAIVPQHSVCLSYNDTNMMHKTTNLFSETQEHCIPSPSLENAVTNGEIATVPLATILANQNNSTSNYIALFIQIFISISISVAFLAQGSILYHTLEGVITSLWSSPTSADIKFDKASKFITVSLIRQWFLALILFSIVYIIASSNPKSFTVVVNQGASLLISIVFGVFMPIIIHRATYSPQFRSSTILLQLPRWILPLQYLIPVYYIVALIYNIYSTIVLIINS